MITLERALALIAAGEEEARGQQLALSFAVVDAGGHLVALHRMDGAAWTTPDIALGKAWTAAAYRAPSAATGEKMRDLPVFSASISVMTHGRFTPQIGGLPITDGDEVIGAMGASGGTGQQDEDVVRAALG